MITIMSDSHAQHHYSFCHIVYLSEFEVIFMNKLEITSKIISYRTVGDITLM